MNPARSGSLWALTSYFNPFKGPLRLQNYRHFRAGLRVPLLTVEWSPDGSFELGPADADILVQLSGGDILWQKERLLNLALPSVPVDCEVLAVLDGDILFEHDDWPLMALEALEHRAMVQLYRQIHYLQPGAYSPHEKAALSSLAVEHRLPALARTVLDGGGIFERCQVQDPFWRSGEARMRGNPGMGVAFRTEVIRKLGFYDANVVGAGDLLLMAAATGRLDEIFAARPYSRAQQQHIGAWAAQVEALGLSDIGCIDVDLYHLWHGVLADRRYGTRQKLLTDLDFDPLVHLEPSAQGPWRWTEKAGALKRAVLDYMVSRHDA